MFNCVHPFPCGYYGARGNPVGVPAVVTKYQKRISGWLSDQRLLCMQLSGQVQLENTPIDIKANCQHVAKGRSRYIEMDRYEVNQINIDERIKAAYSIDLTAVNEALGSRVP